MAVEYPPEIGRQRRQVTAEEAAASARALWLKRAVVGLSIAVVLMCVATSTVTVLIVRMSQVNGTDVLEQTSRTSSRIEDCTTPGRDCYDRGQKQLADTVAGLNRYGIIVASCSSGPVEKSVEDITACVVAKLRTTTPKNATKGTR